MSCGGAASKSMRINTGSKTERLPWVTPNVIILPPHQYVVEAKLQTKEESEAFESLRDSCAHHPNRWKAFFRAYKTKGSYLEIGDYRYWYSQIGAARMMNRSDRESELENIRVGEGERAVKNRSGSDYAWRRLYGQTGGESRIQSNETITPTVRRRIRHRRIVHRACGLCETQE